MAGFTTLTIPAGLDTVPGTAISQVFPSHRNGPYHLGLCVPSTFCITNGPNHLGLSHRSSTPKRSTAQPPTPPRSSTITGKPLPLRCVSTAFVDSVFALRFHCFRVQENAFALRNSSCNETNIYHTAGAGAAVEYTPLFTYAGFR